MKICPICQKEFNPPAKQLGQTYCSRECWRISKLKQVERTCESCGKTFSVYQARGDARFCSFECYSAKVEKQCTYCGSAFYVKRSKVDKRNTCSRSCAAKLRAAEGRSPHQGKPNSPEARAKVSVGLRRYYAGAPERHWNYKDGPFVQKRGIWSQWQSLRNQTRERDGYRCFVCGRTEAELGKQLSIHHIRPFRFFADSSEANDLSNLVSLCQSCHMKVEHGKIDLSGFTL